MTFEIFDSCKSHGRFNYLSTSAITQKENDFSSVKIKPGTHKGAQSVVRGLNLGLQGMIPFLRWYLDIKEYCISSLLHVLNSY